MHRSTWISALLVASGLTIAGLASAGRADPARPRPWPAEDECRGEAGRGRCPAPAAEAPRDQTRRR
jgi:hypothetical protein